MPPTTAGPVTPSWWPASTGSALESTLQGDEGARRFLAARDDVQAVECGDLATGEDVDQP